MKEDCQEWDISRDEPYFGFEIPDAPGKFFYVWLDACIGYISSFKKFCDDHPDTNFDDYWQAGSKTELYHFIGKDIINFHALFWPAVLSSVGYRTPDGVFAHGFLTIDGKKMSKARGTFINAEAYLKHLAPDYLRYYFASKLSNSVDDLDLNFEDFVQKSNTDLVNKLVNIASRCAKFITKGNDGLLSEQLAEPGIWQQFVDKSEPIAALFEAREYSRAVREIMALADIANQYIAEREPWSLAKQPGNEQAVIDICSFGINLFRVLMIYLKPVVPDLAEKAEAFLDIKLEWSGEIQPLLGHKINKFKPMVARIDSKQTQAIIETNASLAADGNKDGNNKDAANNKKKSGKEAKSNAGDAESTEIEYEDFAKIDLRVVKIIQAEAVEGADKLLKLTLDLGDQQRQVFAGIKTAYAAEDLVGRLTVMVANLKPRKMRFGISEGMVLAAGPGGKDIWLLEPDSGAQVGMQVK